MKNLNQLFLLNLFFFLAGLVISAYLTWRDGFKAGPWLITLGFFFLLLMLKEIQKNKQQ